MQIDEGSVERDGLEIGELVKDYRARTILHAWIPPLNFKWDMYHQFERVDLCKIFVARDDDRLIGFAMYLIQDHLHHDNMRVAVCDMIGVKPEDRGVGIGRRLIEHAEQWFRQHGVTHMVHNHRTLYKVTPLFELLGFELKELSYVKEL